MKSGKWNFSRADRTCAYGYGIRANRGLKSIPTLSSRKKQEELQEAKIGVIYPPSVIHGGDVPSIIRQLANERAALHRSRLWWSIIGMPIVAPFALVPLYDTCNL